MNVRFTLFLLLYFFLAGTNETQAQQWTDNLPQKSEAYTLYEYQKAFNDYWEPFNVQNGYYFDENGERQKAPGWKLFKRWEWYWESRVDPQTGAFPDANRIDVYQAEKQYFSARSSHGNWSSLGPSTSDGGYHGLGRINTINFRDGDANTYYAGSPSGGLWKTEDDGISWAVLTDDNDALGVSDVIVIAGATTALDIVYIGTGDRDKGSVSTLNGGQSSDNNGIGVLKSSDGGTTWNTTGLTFKASEAKRVSRLLKDPDNDNILYASVLGAWANQGTVYKTIDGGTTWQILKNKAFIDMEFNPGDKTIMYASTENGEIWKSTDSGTTWDEINLDFGSGRTELAVSPHKPTWLYAVVVNSNTRGLHAVWKSLNNGDSWAKHYDGSQAGHNLLGYKCNGSDLDKGQGEYDLCIAAHPTNADIVYIGGVNTWKSTNGGLSWEISNHWSGQNCAIVDIVHADKHYLGFQPGTNHLFEGNDGGVYKNETGDGLNWLWKGSGMAISQIYRLGLSASASGTYMTGLQDNGSKSATGGTWNDRIGGDGMECLVDFTSNSIQYATEPSGKIHQTTNSWTGSSVITTNIPGNSDTVSNGAWVTPYLLDPNNHTILYVGYKDLWKTENQGNDWIKMNNWPQPPKPEKIHSIAIAPSDSKYIYVADKKSLHVTEDGGSSWSLRTGSLPVGSSSITYISVKHDDPKTAWVSMGQYNSNGVFQTTDAGVTWTNISNGLPQIPVMCVIQNKQNTTDLELYAATDVGVYVKVGEGNWSRFSNGLPNVIITELEIFYESARAVSKLRASTYGRGVWETEIFSASVAPIANFEADNLFPALKNTVTFSDLSENVPTSWAWVFTPNTIEYKNETSAGSPNPQVHFTAEGVYTVELTATNSIGSDIETKTNYITVSNAPTGYCSAGSKGSYAAISNVQFGTIDNTTAWSSPDGYGDYTDMIALMEKGQSIDLKVKTQSGSTDIDVGAWIDWNRDGDFIDPSEKVACGNVDIDGNATFAIVAPAWAETGKTRMRIRSKFQGSGCGESCGETSNGEVEDYGIEIEPGTPTSAPTAEFSTDNTSPKIHNTIHFTDLSTDLPTSWNWTITPNHYTFVNETSSSSAQPQLMFSTEGNYTVSLQVQNSLGNDTETKTDYITVQAISYCPAGSDEGSIGISRVQLNTIDKNSLLANNPMHYEDYTKTDSTSIQTSNNYDLILSTHNAQGLDDLLAWIDWNSDGDFEDANEEIGCGIDINTGTTFNFNVPVDAYLGQTVMRIRAAFNARCGTTTACGNMRFGEVEDYRINIDAGEVTWTGTTSTDWEDGTNWSSGSEPTTSVNVIIPTAPTGGRFPTISSGTNAQCRDLTVQTGATLEIDGSLELLDAAK